MQYIPDSMIFKTISLILNNFMILGCVIDLCTLLDDSRDDTLVLIASTFISKKKNGNVQKLPFVISKLEGNFPYTTQCKETSDL